ncbi:MAG: imidazoleglycerol-phosphate dehydratase HisB [Candidatus Omnitrophota bacterium]
MKEKRQAKFRRKTKETDIEISINLDGRGGTKIKTCIGFLDHMLTLFAYHGLFDLKIKVRKQDLNVDLHHTNEDIGICLGQVVSRALKSKKGICRYGFAAVPMDEALVRVSMDLSSRPSLHTFESFKTIPLLLKTKNKNIYNYENAKQFLHAFSDAAGINMHIETICGDDLHHVLEALFKASGRALSAATRIDKRRKGIPSSKGML